MKPMSQLKAIETIYRNTRPEDLVIGNMNMNTWCIQAAVIEDYPFGIAPGNLLFGVDLGLVTATACGLAMALPRRKVVSVDGDGGILMNLATLTDAARHNPSNLVIVVIDNESYGGGAKEPTATASVADLAAIARGSGIKKTVQVETVEDLAREYRQALEGNELTFIVAKAELKPEDRAVIFDCRHWIDSEWRNAFIRNIEKTEGVTLITTKRIMYK